jgi:hypothetical protein
MNKSNNSFSVFFDKVDNKILKTKIQTAFDMIKDGKYDNISKKLNSVDKNELLEKLNTLDKNDLKEILPQEEINQVRKKLDEIDTECLAQIIGDKGDEIIKKLKQIINERADSNG